MSKWENEIDSILASVDAAMVQAEALAKSEGHPQGCKCEKCMKTEKAELNPGKANGGPMKKDGLPEGEEAPQGEAPAPAAPAAEAGAPEGAGAEGAPSDAPADAGAEGAAAPGGEQALEQESPDAPISDEELKEIYGSMAPEELQRHFMTIREILRGGADAGAQAPAPAAAAPAPAGAPAPQEGEPMAMSEKDTVTKSEIDALKAKNEELEKSLGRLAIVLETALKPERKAATSLDYVRKSEVETEEKTLSKSELREAANKKCSDRSLSKSDRDVLNDFLLRGESSDKVQQIVKGGK